MEKSFVEPVSVILLVHNEADIIERVVKEFHDKIISKLPQAEIIIVEDGSTDGTKEILLKLQQQLSNIRLLQETERLGYVEALKRAVAMTTHSLWLFCDSSGKHDPNDFWKMSELINDYDLVIGTKIHRQDPFYRILLSKGFNFIVNKYFKVNFTDINCPLRLVRSQIFLPILQQKWIQSDLINFELTLRLHAMGARVCEIPVAHFKRVNGASRGLPLKKIPKVIKKTLINAPILKKQLQALAKR